MSYDTEERLSAAMRGIVGDRPFAPDLDQIQSRGRSLRRHRLAWRATAGTSFAIAAVAAVAVATSGAGTKATTGPHVAGAKPGATSSATGSPTTEGGPLIQLVANLTAAPKPAGDATLVLRDQVDVKIGTVDVWDLYADNGDYYFSRTRGGLPAQVKGNHPADGPARAKNVIAAATYAAKGDLTEARKKMAWALREKNSKFPPTYDEPGAQPPPLTESAKKKLKLTGGTYTPRNETDYLVWSNSLDALRAGAGSPTVRAGVVRLLSQMPEVKVTKGTLKGQPVFNLAAGTLATGGVDTETLTINADSGLPIRYASKGQTINFGVTRVTLADVAKGKF